MPTPPLVRVPPVPPGGLLRVISPAGAINPKILTQGAQTLRDLGFQVDIDPRALIKDPNAPFLAGTDTQRAQSLQEAFLDPSVDGIICARGGYGAMRILDKVDWGALRAHPKPFIGFSDITALHGMLAVASHMPSWHGPLLSTLSLHQSPEDPEGREALDAMAAALTGQTAQCELPGLQPVQKGQAEGRLLGGNLTLLASLVGSPWFPSLQGAILFIEEIGESAYRIDRLLTSLALRGVFTQISGLVLGDPGGGGDRYLSSDKLEDFVLARIKDLLGGRNIPVAHKGGFGHRQRNVALPFGTRAELQCHEEGAQLIATPATLWNKT